MVQEVEFADRLSAKSVRGDPLKSQFLADDDDGRKATVRLKDDAPDSVVADARGEAADSRAYERDRGGQAELTDDERKRIDFSREGVNVPFARSVKGIAANEGVDDWLSEADLELTVDENRGVLERAGRTGSGGRRMDAREDEAFDIDREARAFRREKEERLGHAKDAAILDADPDAAGEVRSRGESIGEQWDVRFSRDERGGLRGSGGDYDRVHDRHEQRSSRAQTVDEKRSAKVTRDPAQWAANPGKYDYPGVDTVQPQELHEQRSEKAQSVDERNAAPIADSKEEWANNQDHYDWPGVDTPGGVLNTGPEQQGLGGEATGGPTQASFDVDTGVRDAQGVESRTESEQSSGGLLEDTRGDAGRGSGGGVESEQDGLGSFGVTESGQDRLF